MSAWKSLMASTLALALVAAPASASPVTSSFAPMAARASDDSGIVQVRRGYYRGGHRYYGRRGGNVGLGIGLGIIGGLIVSEALRSAPGYYEGADARELCARNFRSF